MVHHKAVILRAADIAYAEEPFVQRLNPRSRFRLARLGRIAGFARTGVSRGRIPPGGEAFAYHAHQREEEWVFILSGRAMARIDGNELELGPGDFAGFPAPQAPHGLSNPHTEDCVYLMGGERTGAPDVSHFPDLGRSYVLLRDAARVAFHELGAAEFPFGRADAAPDAPWRVLAAKGCGSAIAEAALVLAEIAYEREEVDYTTPAGRDRLAPLNPLAQVPTIVLPDGQVLTETLAIVLHVDELVPGAGLVPVDLRRELMRWLVFAVAAIYPTFTYGDDPAKWQCGDALRDATLAHRERLWRQVEDAAKGPWFMGPRFTAMDPYIAVLTRWQPGRAWFAEMCPKLAAIAVAVDRDPKLASVWAANFGTS